MTVTGEDWEEMEQWLGSGRGGGGGVRGGEDGAGALAGTGCLFIWGTAAGATAV